MKKRCRVPNRRLCASRTPASKVDDSYVPLLMQIPRIRFSDSTIEVSLAYIMDGAYLCVRPNKAQRVFHLTRLDTLLSESGSQLIT